MKKTIEIGMQSRRKFVSTLSGFGAMGAASALGLGLPASNALAQSAQRYKVIDKPINTADQTKVEVLEFFWFGCPHCYAFEPAINAWKDDKPDYVNFVREAPPLNPGWEQHSRTFYAAEVLGITNGMFDQMFHQIHEKKKPMRDPKKIAKFVESLDLGISAAEFRKTMDSFAVNTGLNRSISRAKQAGITGVPAIVVNGKYLTGNTLAGGHQGIIDVINQLSAKEHEAA